MANIVQKLIYVIARRSMTERLSGETRNFFSDRVSADHVARYAFVSEYVKNKIVLDIACGEGYGSSILAKTANAVTGVDTEKHTIVKARKKYTKTISSPIQFIHSEAIDYLNESQTKFDVIVSFETIEHIKEYELFLKLLKKRLKLGGLLVLSTPNKLFSDLLAGDTFNPYHVKEFYSGELVEILIRVFGQKPQRYAQRPVQKNKLMRSFLQSFILKRESLIVKETREITGIDMIYLMYKS